MGAPAVGGPFPGSLPALRPRLDEIEEDVGDIDSRRIVRGKVPTRRVGRRRNWEGEGSHVGSRWKRGNRGRWDVFWRLRRGPAYGGRRGRLVFNKRVGLVDQDTGEHLAIEGALAAPGDHLAVNAHPDIGEVADGIGLARSDVAETCGADRFPNHVKKVWRLPEVRQGVRDVRLLSLGGLWMQMGMGSAEAFGIFGPATAEMTGRIAEVTLEVYGLLLPPPGGGIVSVSDRG